MIGTTLAPSEYLKRMAEEITRIDAASVSQLADLMWERYEAGRMIFLIGNGGSGSNASHFCEDVGKVGVGFAAACLRRLDQTVETCGCFRAGRRV